MTLNDLCAKFPCSNNNCASVGLIPIDYFNANEKEIRAVMKQNSLRSIYRGPRVYRGRMKGYATFTRREDAVGVSLYRKS